MADNEMKGIEALETAFEKSEIIYEERGSRITELNLSSIATKLIQETGRYCERYASDFLINWDNVKNTIEEYHDLSETASKIIYFGIRRDGVDHDAFILSQLTNHIHTAYSIIGNYYRKIYAVKIERVLDDYGYWNTVATLKDIQNNINTYDLKNALTDKTA